jgi:pimeloyl-ACP methyl ester carboxylesterase
MKLQFLDGPNGRIAFERVEARAAGASAPGVVWLGGFKSDMTGTKAEALADWARETGRAFLRFDYSGHGASEGVFEEGCISEWLADSLAAIDELTSGPQVLVGSSMGGWIATLVARERPDRLAGIVYVAPAPDFTERLMWWNMSDEIRDELIAKGRIEEATEYSPEPNVITAKLIEDGRKHAVLDAPININAPIRILQGMADADVPWRHAMALAEALTTDDLQVFMTKTGDHRLSTPDDLGRLVMAVESIE